MLPEQNNQSEQFISSLARLMLVIMGGGTAFIGVLVLFATLRVPDAQAAPVARPRWIVLTGTTSITHTSATTHEMRVYGNGRITDRFLTDNATRTNQIGDSLTATTIAILFDQHPGDSVDVGSQGEFTTTVPITLQTASLIPGYIEDTYAVYASQALSYQVTQQTLAPNTNNCVIMEFFIHNTGALTLTGGKFLFMIDSQVGEVPSEDLGGYDPGRRLLFQTDYNNTTQNGYAVGISLLEGMLRGYGVNTISAIPNTVSDTLVKAEMVTPSNVVGNGPNNVIWMVADTPNLSPDEGTKIVFSICARSSFHPNEVIAENMAREALFITYGDLINLMVRKTALPPSNSPVVVGDLLTYTIAITSIGEFYVDKIVVTDRIPISTNLITYNVSQGAITAASGIVTATVGRLYSTSDTVLMNIVVSPFLSLTNGTLITNQAFINSEPIITPTNVVIHQIATLPVLTLTKQGSLPGPATIVGSPFTYTLTVTNTGGTTATNVNVIDTLPANADYISGGALGPGNVVSWTIPSIPPVGGTAQVSYVVTTCQETLINNEYQVITSTRGITSPPGVEITSLLAPPTFDPQFVHDPLQSGINQPIFFTSTSTSNGAPLVDWSWDFGDGNLGTGATTSHAYANPGTYTVTLSITDACNYQATVSETATVLLPNLIITKQADPEPVQAGSRLTYTVTIFNQSPVDATGVVVSDTLSGSTTFVPASIIIMPGSAGGTSGLPPAIVEDLTVLANSQVTITYQVTVTSPLADGTLITNTVAVSSSQVPTPTIATTTSTVTATPDLTISKSVIPSSLRPGNTITYTVVARNNGNANATGAIISDSIPANTSFVPGTIRLTPLGAGVAGTVPPILASNVTVIAGQQVTATYAVTIDKPLEDGTLITNTASVTSIQTPVPVTASVISLVNATPNLQIDKLATHATPLPPGGVITYSVVVNNVGDANATGAMISDTLPNNISFVPGSLRIEPNGAGVLGSFPTLASDLAITAGQLITVTFAVTVDTPLPNGTVITNTATISSPQELAPKTAVVTSTVMASPNIQIVKAGPISADVGSTAIYTFTLANTGNTPLFVTQLVDDHIGNITNLLSGSDSNGNNQLDLGETWTYTASYTIPVGSPGLITNTAVVTAIDGLFTTVTDSASHLTQVIYKPILVMTKTGPSTAIVGNLVTFTFTVRHAPASDKTPVSNVFVTDNLAGPATRINGDADNRLAGNEVWTYTVGYTIKPSASSNPLVNTGTATAKDLAGETVTAVATHSTSLSGFDPRLFVDKDGPAMAKVGETVTFTFTIINVDLQALAKFNLAKKINASAVGDGSSISLAMVSDNVVTDITYIEGDFNLNGKVDGGEAWIYRGIYKISSAQPDPLTNTVTVKGLDLEGDTITGIDTHSTNISQDPALLIEKIGPATAKLGGSFELTFTIRHDPNKPDKSNITNINVQDNLAGPATLVTAGGNGDTILQAGEVWIYKINYFVGYFSPNPLLGRAMVTGRDLDNDVISSTVTYEIELILSEDTKLWYFPIISKN